MTIMVALSGGVDSAVALKLLQDAGQPVEAMFMKNWEEDDDSEYCNAEQDVHDAKRVCDQLGITLHTVNFSHEYWEQVFQVFLDEIAKGRTPNPDVLCNREIKFRAFLEHAQSLGANTIATGHYAAVDYQDGYYRLYRGSDHSKDQSYFLHQLNQHQLQHAQFPLGNLAKTKVRELARQQGFDNAAKKDSTGICFIGERPFREFLSRYVSTEPGDMITTNGAVIKQHDGLAFYTLGQRKGLHIGGVAGYPEAPWYVLQKNTDNNTLVVGQNPQDPLLLSHEVTIETPHWIAEQPNSPYRCTAKTRYRQADSACTITHYDNHRLTVRFDTPEWAATPGQSLVLYQDRECLGGGIIQETA
jgi:tRNA-uridine 2-sulfurtransferase